MIWLTWKQHHRQVLFAAVGLAVLVAVMVPTGLREHRAFADLGLAECLRAADPGARCDAAVTQFLTRYNGLAPLGILFIFLPLLVGLFFGAPLVAREVERGTHRLIWTQGVTRLRWAAVKFGLVMAGSLAVAVAYALLLSWWVAPIGRVSGRMELLFFDTHGVVPVAYTVFAVALGIFAGTVTRKVLPAMAVTLVGFVVLRGVVATLARPRFLPQRRRTYTVAHGVQPDRQAGDWIISQDIHDASGRTVAEGMSVCTWPDPVPVPDPCEEQYGAGAYNLEIFQPGDRFWTFQAIEAGLFAALAVLLLALAVHRVRRRIS